MYHWYVSHLLPEVNVNNVPRVRLWCQWERGGHFGRSTISRTFTFHSIFLLWRLRKTKTFLYVLGLQGNLKEEVKMLELLLLSLTVFCIYILAKRWGIHIVRSVLFSKRFLSTFLIIYAFSAALSQKLPQRWQKSHKKLRFLVKEFPKLHLITSFASASNGSTWPGLGQFRSHKYWLGPLRVEIDLATIVNLCIECARSPSH